MIPLRDTVPSRRFPIVNVSLLSMRYVYPARLPHLHHPTSIRTNTGDRGGNAIQAGQR
jgi:hypothetical protein